jgi:Tol biopolymer transport system component
LPPAGAATPADDLPPHITRLTNFGERAEWSHDGRKILFVEKTFGDVYEIDLEERAISLLTRHFHHEGFLRAMYLSNGDILLFGPRKFDPSDPYKSRWRDSELWVLDKNLDKPPVALGTEVFEGAAVSRTRLRIVWMIGHADYYDTDDLLEPRNLPEGAAQFWIADIDYASGRPELANKELVLDSRNLPFEADIEPQAFRRPDERELIFAAYRYNGVKVMGTNTEVMGVDLETGEVTNYTNSPLYEEPEGIFPDGRRTLVESDRHRGGGDKNIDLYELRLDGSGIMNRLTYFNDSPGYKASNPVVSDDGRYIAFQMARSADMPGVGRGLFLYDIQRAEGRMP